MAKIKVFLDTDVIISSLLSRTGASYNVINNPKIEKENISVEQAIHSGRTFDAPWYLTATIEDPLNKKSKKQVIYMGDIPLMTERGTYIVNGVERVVVNQLIRSEGVLFTGMSSPITGQFLAGAKVLPKNGVWLEIETARSGVISVKIDRQNQLLLKILPLPTTKLVSKYTEK